MQQIFTGAQRTRLHRWERERERESSRKTICQLCFRSNFITQFIRSIDPTRPPPRPPPPPMQYLCNPVVVPGQIANVGRKKKQFSLSPRLLWKLHLASADPTGKKVYCNFFTGEQYNDEAILGREKIKNVKIMAGEIEGGTENGNLCHITLHTQMNHYNSIFIHYTHIA